MKKWFFSYRNNDISCTNAREHATPPIHIQYERFLSGIGGGDDAIAIGYLSGNRCHVARDDMIAISASNVVG